MLTQKTFVRIINLIDIANNSICIVYVGIWYIGKNEVSTWHTNAYTLYKKKGYFQTYCESAANQMIFANPSDVLCTYASSPTKMSKLIN